MNNTNIKVLRRLCERLPESELTKLNNGLEKFFKKHPMPNDVLNEVKKIRGVIGGDISDVGIQLAGIVFLGLISWYLYHLYYSKKSSKPSPYNPTFYINNTTFQITDHSSSDVCSNLDIDYKNQEFLDTLIFKNTILKNDIKYIYNDKTLTQLKIKDNYTFDAKRIDRGSFGTVYELYDKNKKVKLAVKIPNNMSSDDIILDEELVSKIGCNVLRVKSIDNKFFMELADGNMLNFIKKVPLTNDTIFNMVDQIRDQILCLLHNSNGNYFYTDVKLRNTLYKCINDSKLSIKVFLGDLASAMLIDGFNIKTYPPWEYRYNMSVPDDNLRKYEVISWSIGILLAQFANIDIKRLKNQSIGKTKLSTLIKIQDKLEEAYGIVYRTYLAENPSLRPNVYISVKTFDESKYSS